MIEQEHILAGVAKSIWTTPKNKNQLNLSALIFMAEPFLKIKWQEDFKNLKIITYFDSSGNSLPLMRDNYLATRFSYWMPKYRFTDFYMREFILKT